MTMEYDDIIDLPHPDPRQHQRMDLDSRAAQFMPFSALNGFDNMLQEEDDALIYTIEEEELAEW